MLLHIVHDDIVVPRMISQFEEVAPGNNIYICVGDTNNKSDLRFLGGNEHVIMSNSKQVTNIPWKNIDKICFHYITSKKITYYRKLQFKYGLKKTKKIWFFWGADIYHILGRKGFSLYSEDNSYALMQRARATNTSFKDYFKQCFQKLRSKLSDDYICYFLDKNIDYVVCNSDDEYKLFRKYVRFSNCKERLNYHYYPIEDTLGSLIDARTHGTSIILGNSADPSNNHEHILSLINGVSRIDRNIYVPLNYSGNDDYVKIIKEKCARIPNTIVLNKFLPLEEYHNLLADCSTFIYAHYRAEAWGNILVALFLGGKVYVSEKSIIPAYLKSMGFKYFITEDLNNSFFIELSQEERDNNRRIAMKFFSREINRKYIKYICDI